MKLTTLFPLAIIIFFTITACDKEHTPIAKAIKADSIKRTSAKLIGSVNPKNNTVSVQIEYGETEDYGQTIKANPDTLTGNDFFDVSATVNDLKPNTYYHFRIKVEYNGKTTYSADQNFKTADNLYDFASCFGGSNSDMLRSIYSDDYDFIAAGLSYSSDGDVLNNKGASDFWIVKIETQGQLQWQKSFGGSDADCANSIWQTSNGNYVIAGYTLSNDGDVSGNHGGSDVWVIKIDASGNLLWQKCFGGTNDEVARSIKETTDGGYIVAGYASSNNGDVSNNHGGRDFWLLKLNSNGELQWQKTFGGSYDDEANAVAVCPDGGYIIVGSSYSNDGDLEANYGQYDYWIVKTDANGNMLWQKNMGGSADDQAKDVSLLDDGSAIIIGQSASNDYDITDNHGGYDYWVIELNNDGQIDWKKSFGGTNDDYGTTVSAENGNTYISGYSNSSDGDIQNNHGSYDFCTFKIGVKGQIIWSRCFGGGSDDFARASDRNIYGDLILAGTTYSDDGDVLSNHGMCDFWVLKTE